MWPLSPITVLDKLGLQEPSSPSPSCTPSQTSALDLSLLQSSPPDGTELWHANVLLLSELHKTDGLPSPVRRYAERVTRALETTQSENVTLHKELAASQQLLRTRKNRKSGK